MSGLGSIGLAFDDRDEIPTSSFDPRGDAHGYYEWEQEQVDNVVCRDKEATEKKPDIALAGSGE